LLGHDASEVIGKNFSQFIHTDDLPRCYEFVRQILTTGEKATGIEYRIRHRNGTWKLHATAGSPIRDETGRIVSFLGTCRDITESKKAENALRQANRQYNLLNSITRHDINNKITAIIGYLDLAEESITTPELAEYFGRIKTLTDAVRSQISFTRIYQDLGTQEPRWQDLGIIMPFSHIPGTIAFYSDLNGIEVYADMMMEKVFFNLLDNSIRHGQRVTGIRVYTRESDDGLVVVWEDNGSGIPDTDKEQIFERGFGRNTGLGMFLVREILSLTDITIAETGVAGTGARFEISVPKGMYRYGLQSNRTGQN
jgi:PAS domain S-box-containing protein